NMAVSFIYHEIGPLGCTHWVGNNYEQSYVRQFAKCSIDVHRHIFTVWRTHPQWFFNCCEPGPFDLTDSRWNSYVTNFVRNRVVDTATNLFRTLTLELFGTVTNLLRTLMSTGLNVKLRLTTFLN